jgi:putative hemolysin
VDDIIGILDTRDYFRMEEKTKESIMEYAVKPAYFVPENVKADVLFRNMKQHKESIAIVLDEYGGVRGLITVTDLVECLVGEFAETDEDEETVEPIVQLDERSWQINGSLTISDLEDALNMEISDCDSDTFSGFAMGLYGSIPEDGSTFEVENDLFEIHVLEIREHRIESAILTLKEQNAEEEEDSAKSQKAEATL